MLYQPPCALPPQAYVHTSAYTGTLTAYRLTKNEPAETDHLEREDFNPDGWGDARQTVPFAVTGSASYSFNIPIEIAPNWSDLRRAEKILADCVRRWQ
jgi:hypothetical protein